MTENGEQLQTVGHHFRLSRPLNNDERIHMQRDSVCIACHQEIPEGTLATSMLHHVADAIGMLPKTDDILLGLPINCFGSSNHLGS